MEISYYQNLEGYRISVKPPFGPEARDIKMRVLIKETTFTREHLYEISNCIKAIQDRVKEVSIKLSWSPVRRIASDLDIHEFGEALHYCTSLDEVDVPFKMQSAQMDIITRRAYQTGGRRLVFIAPDGYIYVDGPCAYDWFIPLMRAAVFQKSKFPLPIELIRILITYLL